MTQPYSGAEVMRDLLELGARSLVPGGRLVYLIPVDVASYDPAQLPAHRCLALVANSEQKLGVSLSRRLITMEKVHPYGAEDYARFEEQLRDAEALKQRSSSGGDAAAAVAAVAGEATNFYSDLGAKHAKRKRELRALREKEAEEKQRAKAGRITREAPSAEL